MKPSLYEKHALKLLAKKEAILGKQALLDTWEQSPKYNHKDALILRAKIRNLKNQLEVMAQLKQEEEL